MSDGGVPLTASAEHPVRLLITGADGFVGRHVLRTLAACETGMLAGCAVEPCARSARIDDEFGPLSGLDVTVPSTIDTVLARFKPTHVLHLAGIAATSGTTFDQRQLWETNTFGPLAIVDAMRRLTPGAAFVLVGSGMIYGDRAERDAAFNETSLLEPGSVYAVTKAAADLALGSLAGGPIKIIRLRPFNHTGVGQIEDFAVPRFAAQIARIEAGLQAPEIRTGDLEAERDFLDVSDVADAYLRTIERSSTLPSGSILNVASGQPRRIGDVLTTLVGLSRCPMTIVSGGAGGTGHVSRSVGDAAVARRVLSWAPRVDFDTTVRTVLDDWRRRTTVATQHA